MGEQSYIAETHGRTVRFSLFSMVVNFSGESYNSDMIRALGRGKNGRI